MAERSYKAAVDSGVGSYRPPVMGLNHMVVAGQYMAAVAGSRILEQGGNAIDAGVAAGIAINVVQPDKTSFGGVAPIILYSARDKKVVTISGLGRWSKTASIDHFTQSHGGDMPAGLPRVVVPAAASAWLTALEEYGSMSFEQVVTPALELARDGFPVYVTLESALAALTAELAEWPTSAEVFAPGGQTLRLGERVVQPALARTFERLIAIERSASGSGREAGISAARDFFYRGEIAEEIVAFVHGGGGLLTLDDMAAFEVGHEAPVVGRFKEYELYGCGPWCQGPVAPQAAQILANDDLSGLTHNSADYIHVVIEALKLSYADRDAFFGDPDFVDVPLAGLFSDEYTAARRGEIDMARPTPEMPLAGDPWRHEGRPAPDDYAYARPEAPVAPVEADTSYVCSVDAEGNMFSATPSDTLGMAPVIPSLGFTPSGRGTSNWLDPRHPAALAPWKRPRLTPNPAIAFKDGEPWMPFGTPGGDAQPQSMLQAFLNIAEFGMNPQQAVEAPRFLTWSFPNSFWPHGYRPGEVELESRIDPATEQELSRRGHRVSLLSDFAATAGSVAAITRDAKTGLLTGGADPRREAYAIGR